MKHVVDNVEALYERKEPWGDAFIDQVVTALRQTSLIRVHDLAVHLEADERELRGAFHLLTGLHLADALTEWRYLQAKDLLESFQYPLDAVARMCGWQSVRVMDNVFLRHGQPTATAIMHRHESEPIRDLKRKLRKLRKRRK